ncbi:hypothetical protein SIID45300_01180 [Candidatus Magnetaquicoccaceae bacterium FCR-1]|uniref:Uncharacterized protein n=1 Tax=Candidatus Magnetaquiglobus chichijimensis TaxID=3141448 RepID=A0ABQ0C7K1_9PROT
MRRISTEPVIQPIDLTRCGELPDCPLADAARVAGVADEALLRYLEEANSVPGDGRIRLGVLIRAAFTLLGRKENQAAMLRQQLSATLDRERQLSETLRAGLLGSGVVVDVPQVAEPRGVESPVGVNTKALPAKKKKKR